eukprot:3923103-Rhodomonas_salina.3
MSLSYQSWGFVVGKGVADDRLGAKGERKKRKVRFSRYQSRGFVVGEGIADDGLVEGVERVGALVAEVHDHVVVWYQTHTD